MPKSIAVKPFYNFLDYILSRPSSFCIRNTSDLWFFVQGYLSVLSIYEIGDPDADHFQGFNEFINVKYQAGGSQNWGDIIQSKSSGDKHSLELFSLLLMKYKETGSAYNIKRDW